MVTEEGRRALAVAVSGLEEAAEGLERFGVAA